MKVGNLHTGKVRLGPPLTKRSDLEAASLAGSFHEAANGIQIKGPFTRKTYALTELIMIYI